MKLAHMPSRVSFEQALEAELAEHDQILGEREEALRQREETLKEKESALKEKEALMAECSETVTTGKASLSDLQQQTRRRIETVMRKRVSIFWADRIPTFHTAVGRQEKADFIAHLHDLEQVSTLLRATGFTFRTLKLTDKVLSGKLIKHCSYKHTGKRKRTHEAAGHLGLEAQLPEEEENDENIRNARLYTELKTILGASTLREVTKPAILTILTKYNQAAKKSQPKADLVSKLVCCLKQPREHGNYHEDFKQAKEMEAQEKQERARQRADNAEGAAVAEAPAASPQEPLHAPALEPAQLRPPETEREEPQPPIRPSLSAAYSDIQHGTGSTVHLGKRTHSRPARYEEEQEEEEEDELPRSRICTRSCSQH